MNPELKNKTWLTLLLRWMSGDATRKDEQTLEALAKDDPFLAEALEGYRTLPEGNHAAAVTKLKADLRRRYDKRRRGAVFYLARVAAAGLVLVVAWAVFRQFGEAEKSSENVAQAMQKETQAQPEAPSASAEMAAADTTQVATISSLKKETPSAQAFTKEKSARSSQPVKEQLVFADEVAEVIPPAQIPETFGPVGNATSKDSSLASKVADDDRADKPEEKVAAAPSTLAAGRASAPAARMEAGKGASPLRLITGKVTSVASEPLIGASVLAKNSNRGTVTDLDGTFKIGVGSEVKELVFSYTGYQSQEIALGQQSQLVVRLVESSEALSEVVVTGLDSRKKSKHEPTASPEPEGGFKKLEKYLEKNLRYPEAAAQNGVEGEVTLRFRVMPDGALTDFEKIKSLGSDCDEEAERLLLEGPKWKPVGVTTYTVKFQL